MEMLNDLSQETKDALMELGTLKDISDSGRRRYRLSLDEDETSMISIMQSELENNPWRLRWYCQGRNNLIDPVVFPWASSAFKDTAYFQDESSLVRQCQLLAEYNEKFTWEKDILRAVGRIKDALRPIEDHPDWFFGNIFIPEELQNEVSECVDRLQSDITDFRMLFFKISDFGVLDER